MCLLNARSINNKLDELHVLISELSPDVICITESWLDSTVCDAAVSISSYTFHRVDRSTGQKGGGIACWIRNELSSSILFRNSNHSEVEFLILKLIHGNFRCILCILYFPKGQSLNNTTKQYLLTYVCSVIDSFLIQFSDHDVYIAGDFNLVDPSTFEVYYGINNIIHEPTRLDNILDLILIPEHYISHYQKPVFLSPLAGSDHNVLFVEPQQRISYDIEFVYVMDLRESNFIKSCSYLSQIDWIPLFENLSLNEACETFYNFLRFAMDYIPQDMIKRSTRDKPWINNVVKVLINKRYAAYRNKNWSLYEHYKLKVRQAIYVAKKQWGSNFLEKSGHSIWDVYKIVTSDSKLNKNWLPLCDPTRPVTDIITDINVNLHQVFNVDSPHDYSDGTLGYDLPFTFTENMVEKILANVNPKKSAGSDGVDSIIWSKFSDVLAKPVCLLYNKCLADADVPQKWKNADITPCPKTSPPDLFHIRPISLLPVLERLFEKHLLKFIGAEFIDRYDHRQFGYRKKGSTAAALVDLDNYISSNLQDSDTVACHLLVLDLEKGFDKLSHQILLEKMRRDGFSNFTLTFVKNYLHSRYQRVRWKHQFSDFLPVSSGIPQGSCIGPIVFSYFCADMPLPQTSDTLVIKYADDIIIVGIIKKGTTISPVSSAYDDMLRWVSVNGMSVKAEKSRQMYFHQRGSPDICHLSIPLIPCVSSIKLLGVTFDPKLNYHSHVYNITKKASSRLYVLRQLKPYLPLDGLIKIYENCIRSILEYCAPLLVGTSAANCSAIERIQDRAHKIICGVSASECTCSHFVPLSYRRMIIGFKLFISFIQHRDHPLYHLTPRRLVFSNNFCIPVCKSALRGNSYIVNMIRLHNSGFKC